MPYYTLKTVFLRCYYVLSPQSHRYIFLIGLAGLAGGMLFGTVPTSIPQFVLFGNWLLEGRFKEKWQILKSNKLVWILSSVFLMHLTGLIHTSELSRGIEDIRIKIPLQLLPLVFFTTPPITKKELHQLLWFFIVCLIASSLWCLFYAATHDLPDIRKASRFMSHIRFGLFVNLAICTLFYFIQKSESLKIKIAAIAAVVYLITVMVTLSMVTGLVMLVILSGIYFVYLLFRQKSLYRNIGFFSLISVVIFIVLTISSEWKKFNYIDNSAANIKKEKTLSGRPYFTVDSTNFHTENGFFVAYNIQYDELGFSWKKRSNVDLFSYDKHGTLFTWNVIRYLTSKGLTKDSAGVAQLTDEDVKNIEKGITNCNYTDASPIRKRLKELFWEYKDYEQGFNPSGNTMLMRMEFWKAAVYIIKRNTLFGVGTGDTQLAFNRAYYRTKTKLSQEWRLRAHNQFLAITVAFGVAGLLVFLFYLIYPVVSLRKQLNKLYYLFFLIAIVSFFTEDTLETQSGVSFFAFFNTLFLWLADAEKTAAEQTNQN